MILGIIETGGYKAPELVAALDIESYDTEIRVVLDANIESYPPQGVIIVGGEQIYYLGKTSDTFTDCVRGYNNTVALDHPRGSKIEDRQHGARNH